MSWLSGAVNAQQGRLDEAIGNFQTVLTTKVPERGFDFSRDYSVRNELGQAQFQRAQQFRSEAQKAQRDSWLQQAIDTFQQTLAIDSENAPAHYNLERAYRQLGNEEQAEHHGRMHLKYKGDDSIQGEVIGKARMKYPAADHAAEALVIYPLNRDLPPPEN
jgi:tetratricopeptide (TPR) repeat protein